VSPRGIQLPKDLDEILHFVQNDTFKKRCRRDLSCRGNWGCPPDFKKPPRLGVRGLISELPNLDDSDVKENL
jgi:hypothetical protein